MKGLALVVGVNGQDGSFLAKHLYHQSWNVQGIGRQNYPRVGVNCYLSNYIQMDIADLLSFKQVLDQLQPDIIFYAAAVHGPAGYIYEDVWLAAHQVNTLSLQAALEHARLAKKRVKIVYLSSGKVFGELGGKEIVEESCKFNNCIYSITKNTSASLVDYYRQKHAVDASLIWLFNHESEWRANDFFVKKIVRIVAKSMTDLNYREEVKTLDFWCDWGHADEFMFLLAKHCKTLGAEDYILATGRTVWARDVVKEFFSLNGLEIDRHITAQYTSEKDNNECWTANIDKFRTKTNEYPKISGTDVFVKVLSKL
jgi:GDPmannose 4,6-dehydratase